MTNRKQLFIMAHIDKEPAAVCIISRTVQPFIFVSCILKSPRQIPTVPAQRVDYSFPICCPEQTQPYQSKPGQLLFHILLMYWKARHSRLPLAARPEDVSVLCSTMENNQAFLLDLVVVGGTPPRPDCCLVRLCFNAEAQGSLQALVLCARSVSETRGLNKQ